MNRVILLFSILSLALTSCSIDRLEETQVIEGLDGTSTLVTSSTEPQGENCENGGVRLDFGLDLDFSGTLDANEITTTSYVCNGLDGEDAEAYLTDIIALDGNEECPNGGVIVVTGIDFNDNGTLDPEEYQTENVICNGVDGNDGNDGQDGTDGSNGNDGQNGSNTIVDTNPIPENDERCSNGVGGVEIIIGVDDNNNGVLDEEEIDSIEIVCNGQDGLSMLFNIVDSEECPNGGSLIQVGLDRNRNDVLDQDEVLNSFEVCNGENGFNSLVFTERIDGENPGVRISSGLDLNRNGTLDDSEVTSTIVVRDGEDGQDGQDGEDGQDGFNTITDYVTTDNGVIIYSGLDNGDGDGVSRDGVLHPDERDNEASIPNGLNSLIEMTPIPPASPYCDIKEEVIVPYSGNDNIARITFISGLEDEEGNFLGYKWRLRNGTNEAINDVEVRKPNQVIYSTESVSARTEVFFITQDPIAGVTLFWDGGSKGTASTNDTIEQGCSGNGGILIQVGLDLNNNGILDGNEINDEYLIENGEDGTDGSDGQDGSDGDDGSDGQDGMCTLINIEKELPGENCPSGGVRIEFGKDDDRNHVLDPGEVENTEYFCYPTDCTVVREIDQVISFDDSLNNFEAGDIVDQIFTNYGFIFVEGVKGNRGRNKPNNAMIFDSSNPTGGDDDLETPSNGNILIISEDGDSSDPDDNAGGGVIRFDFSEFASGSVDVGTIQLIDVEPTNNSGNTDDSSNRIKLNFEGGGSEVIRGLGGANNEIQTIQINRPNVESMEVILHGSGAVDNLILSATIVEFTCIELPPFPGPNPQ